MAKKGSEWLRDWLQHVDKTKCIGARLGIPTISDKTKEDIENEIKEKLARRMRLEAIESKEQEVSRKLRRNLQPRGEVGRLIVEEVRRKEGGKAD